MILIQEFREIKEDFVSEDYVGCKIPKVYKDIPKIEIKEEKETEEMVNVAKRGRQAEKLLTKEQADFVRENLHLGLDVLSKKVDMSTATLHKNMKKLNIPTRLIDRFTVDDVKEMFNSCEAFGVEATINKFNITVASLYTLF